MRTKCAYSSSTKFFNFEEGVGKREEDGGSTPLISLSCICFGFGFNFKLDYI